MFGNNPLLFGLLGVVASVGVSTACYLRLRSSVELSMPKAVSLAFLCVLSLAAAFGSFAWGFSGQLKIDPPKPTTVQLYCKGQITATMVGFHLPAKTCRVVEENDGWQVTCSPPLTLPRVAMNLECQR